MEVLIIVKTQLDRRCGYMGTLLSALFFRKPNSFSLKKKKKGLNVRKTLWWLLLYSTCFIKIKI